MPSIFDLLAYARGEIHCVGAEIGGHDRLDSADRHARDAAVRVHALERSLADAIGLAAVLAAEAPEPVLLRLRAAERIGRAREELLYASGEAEPPLLAAKEAS